MNSNKIREAIVFCGRDYANCTTYLRSHGVKQVVYEKVDNNARNCVIAARKARFHCRIARTVMDIARNCVMAVDNANRAGQPA